MAVQLADVSVYENPEVRSVTPADDRNQDYETYERLRRSPKNSSLGDRLTPERRGFFVQFIVTFLASVATSILVSYLVARSFRGKYLSYDAPEKTTPTNVHTTYIHIKTYPRKRRYETK